MNIADLKTKMLEAAREAGQGFLDTHYGGQDQGACGFAWTNIYPAHDGRTSAGKQERKIYAQLGFEKDWTGKAYMLWNPSGLSAQNIDAKEAGARAAALVLQEAGFSASVGSRLD